MVLGRIIEWFERRTTVRAAYEVYEYVSRIYLYAGVGVNVEVRATTWNVVHAIRLVRRFWSP